MQNKYNELITYLKNLGSVAVAFSGGVDSTFLAYAAKEALGDKAIAYTVNSPYIPDWEIDEAKELAETIGIRHEIMTVGLSEIIIDNPVDRCYLCKTLIFSQIKAKALADGFEYVADGSNTDDTKDYRPGMIALKELGIKSPLLETGFSKLDIRISSKLFKLATHDKPAYACLLTRLPYDHRITLDELERVERSEVFLHSLGLKAVRVRSHGEIARIEIAKDQRDRFFDTGIMDKINDQLKEYGFTFVSLDLAGYKMGSLNHTIQSEERL
ncbi:MULTISPECIES: ATP-dependent sacrificial sulfur transferase LarE [unclassified Fusibacter]|uniref:ATP-dependent sacrificial sulfur transferase LarE n=1 Tax=unclassified Fusibacter TaxID=2624464 RepID=UPI0010107D05|nr:MULTISPECIES: ATP-dependent sacrificial sulfur transferase LarE [unclassified Fusibacter]MCK8060807.1 ATP-dependent sacrificial sulfur transferase LarE [Fusibacter sp. A2]NPE23103.1 ATP-dependent sacrificial sulfur transferase LarE [Fusibacter sp. A1]RXV59774.1 ATP-dependent sacrificial sulfur transferase LarE [Fusibacter sp. A1]